VNKLAIWPAVFMLLVLLLSAAIATTSSTNSEFGWCLPQSSTDEDESDASVAGLDQEQADNAGIIITVGRDLNVPPRGWVIAIATALQESGLRNLPHLGADNDHDSLGLFQQRPSMGWGTPEQIQDPVYASTAFYERLLEVPDWHLLPLTEAAQAVQRSAYPDAYAQHEQQATQIVNAITGIDCSVITATGWTRPLAGEVVSGFRTASRPDHYGIDIPAGPGATIRAAAAGTVTLITCQATQGGQPYSCDVAGSESVSGCGWYLQILHAERIVTRYCHLLSRPEVHVGDEVTAGQPIGLVGSSGHSSGPHLHLEVEIRTILDRDEGGVTVEQRQVDPMPFFAARGIIYECVSGSDCQPAHGDRVRIEHRRR